MTEIVKNIKISTNKRKAVYPWNDPSLEIGDGFAYRGALRSAKTTIYRAAKKYGRTFEAGTIAGKVYIRRIG